MSRGCIEGPPLEKQPLLLIMVVGGGKKQKIPSPLFGRPPWGERLEEISLIIPLTVRRRDAHQKGGYTHQSSRVTFLLGVPTHIGGRSSNKTLIKTALREVCGGATKLCVRTIGVKTRVV